MSEESPATKRRTPKFDGMRLRQFRHQRFPGRTLEKVAREHLGKSKQSLSDIERGGVDCSASSLIEMMLAYRVYDIREILPAVRRARLREHESTTL